MNECLRPLPIVFSGLKHSLAPHGRARRELNWYLQVQAGCSGSSEYWYGRAGQQTKLELHDETGNVSHVAFVASARRLTRALFIVSVQERGEQLAARLETGGKLPLKVVRRHRFPIYQ
ncbi:MAG: hypothetical protein UT32_C0007G0034 [Parcubacteria group bacterium GW2011_GWC2_39_14]|nr:MAG: hypothetical protein UT32_C0007G0034 [Parcubacteria group bacterium GW2011_GWC2_39_14]